MDLLPDVAESTLPIAKFERLLNSYKEAVCHIKRFIYSVDPIDFDGVFELLETFQRDVSRFQPITSTGEFNRVLAQPMLMVPYITEQL